MESEKINVLLIEDNPGDARLVKEMLAEARDEPFKLEWVGRLSGGLERLEKGEINLVLLDLGLPDSVGLDTFRGVHEKAPELPIVVFSGSNDETMAIEAVKQGAQDYLVKGNVDTSLLVRSMRYAVERKKAEEKIKYMAYHDALTGLSNRKHFRESLDQALEHARRTGRMLAVIFLDLDRFKVINDTLGHDIGDLLLQSAAGRLKSCVRKEDTVARQGGDEFTLLIVEVPHVEDVVGIAGKIIESIKQPYMLEGHELFITTSMGVAFFPNDGEDAETLLKNADTAMYRAKEEGRDKYQLYSPSMHTNVLEKLELENSLRRALKNQELMVYYQPLVNLNTGEIVGMEALARWRHNQRGIVAATEFIPLAEDIGLIIPIGEWVLRTACKQNKAWQEAGLPPVCVAVNLSAHMFQKQGLPEVVGRVLKDTGLPPSLLELEITETVLMKDLEAGARTLAELKDMGVHVAIDDFGTGYSSLSYLTRLPVDKLKIDQSFVRDLTIHPDNDAVVKATVAMAHSLKLKAVAEGVETPAQLEFLRSAKCDEIQGTLFNKPVPPEEFEKLLREGKRLSSVLEHGVGN
ncbi:MAG: EAL domain-containing protein [Candidatus Brocadiales bacterium]|nr:EAL domain-containing protein [Candidatus Bathyanammoxibius amoris]